MKIRVNYLALAALLLATAVPALSNIALPKEERGKPRNSSAFTTAMKIATDEKVNEARLVIPREVWQQMKAGLDGEGSQNAAVAGRTFNLGGTQTVVSGVFLSLAFAFGGVWLVRSRRQALRFGPAALCVIALALCGAFAGAAYANAGPPPVARSLTSKILIDDLQWWGAYGQVKVEVSGDADRVTLILPRTKKEESK
ncbi:MAG TPA: hypothetical protein VEX60_10835 [Pyrinomonadaceae bacterium]|nr:hypothetical protein [Pyrinomonadaceae bacterium]